MNANRMIATALLVMGVGCASNPQSNMTVLDVGSGQRDLYWTPKNTTIKTHHPDTPAAAATLAIVQYVIDGGGKVRDAKVLRAEPSTSDASWALRVMESYSFIPTEKNKMRQPIRTSHEIVLR